MLLEQFFPPVEIALVLEPEELALPLLKYLVAMGHRGREPDLNIRNFYAGSEVDAYAGEKSDEMSRAIVEAWMWLEREGMLAPYLRKGREWVSMTRRGTKLAEESDIDGYVRRNLIPKQSLDPVLADKVWPLFIRGDYDTAVFQAFKEVEIRARTAASLSPESYGTSLMRDAFHPENGVLTDSSLPSAERQATSVVSYKCLYSPCHSSKPMKNPFDQPPDPLPVQEGGKDYIWGTPPDPCQRRLRPLSEEGAPLRRGEAPLDSPFFITLLGSIRDTCLPPGFQPALE